MTLQTFHRNRKPHHDRGLRSRLVVWVWLKVSLGFDVRTSGVNPFCFPKANLKNNRSSSKSDASGTLKWKTCNLSTCSTLPNETDSLLLMFRLPPIAVCPPGAGGGSCDACPANTFSRGGPSASTTCQPCPSGFVSQPGAASCDSCAPGYAGPNCAISSKGSYSAGGSPQSSVCQPCADFSVAAKAGSSSCQQCPLGHGTSVDRTTCGECQIVDT